MFFHAAIHHHLKRPVHGCLRKRMVVCGSSFAKLCCRWEENSNMELNYKVFIFFPMPTALEILPVPFSLYK